MSGRDRTRIKEPHWRRRIVALVILLALIGLPLGIYVSHRLRPGDVFHPHVAYQPGAPPQTKPAPAQWPWPLYGATKDHARYYAAPRSLHPPFRRVWRLGGDALLEFPPVLVNGTLFQLNDSAVLHAIAANNGRVRWQHKVGTLSASSPAAGGQTVYVSVLKGFDGRGRIIAVNARNGSPRWARTLPSPTESSPLLDRGRLYVGSQNGTVYALRASDGRPLWTYHAGGSVKASPTLLDGKLFFGDYGGHMQAVYENSGRPAWVTGEKGLVGGGNFYSTPAVAFGRVFAGNTDGRVYAFDTRTGNLAWARQTGSYVYSSPAVADPPGLGPTIYVGSYDGSFYALSAYSGHVRWRFEAHGKISGSPEVIGSTVYFADLGTHITYGLDATHGNVTFLQHNGSFDPVITDGQRIYLTGLTGLYALEPRPRGRPRPKRARPAPPPKPAPRPQAAFCANPFTKNPGPAFC